MRYLVWVVRLAVFAVLLAFAMHNVTAVQVRFFLGYSWTAPLVLVLLLVLALGVGLGMLAMLGRVARLRRELLQLRRERRTRGDTQPAIDAPPRM